MAPISRSGAGRGSLAALICGALAAGGLAAAGVTALEPGAASGSSHREAPLISGQPRYDNTDVYAFVSPDKPDTTTITANWVPFQDPAGGPDFYTFADDAQYDLRIDIDGDAQSELGSAASPSTATTVSSPPPACSGSTTSRTSPRSRRPRPGRTSSGSAWPGGRGSGA